jgi:SAM-dependent methyltransferase
MAVPETVTTALADRSVAGRVCLEAGAGVGNTTAGLLDAGARRVYAVTDEREHAELTRDRATEHGSDPSGESGGGPRLAVLEADLRAVPLPDDSVDVITAHGLCNVLDPPTLSAVAAELSRVAAPGADLIVDDYDPLPADAAVRELFSVENAAAELATGRPALTFYPADFLRRVFSGWGWHAERERTLLDPVPWTESHLDAHAEVAAEHAAACPEGVGDVLARRASRLADEIGAESAGRMYSVALRLEE